MRRVLQSKEECGTACLAMLAGVTLVEARKRFPAHCQSKGATIAELRAAALSFGVETDGRRPILNRDFNEFDFDAVLLGTLGDDPHWSVWDAKRRKRLDPYKEADKWEWICRSYLKVTHRPVT